MGALSTLLILTSALVGLYADSIIPGRHHNILLDTENNGAFDLFFNTENGAKIGCRGNVVKGKENLKEVYFEDMAGHLRNGKTKNSVLRLLVVPNLSRDYSNSSIETLGLANFALWPRECILALIKHNPEHLLAEESHEDIQSGVFDKKSYLVDSKSASETPLGWWRRYPESEITDSLAARGCENNKSGSGCSCRIAADGSRVGGDACGVIKGGGGGGGGGGGCDACNACQRCPAWGPVLGGNNNDFFCTWLQLTVVNGVPVGGGGGGKKPSSGGAAGTAPASSVAAPVTKKTAPTSDEAALASSQAVPASNAAAPALNAAVPVSNAAAPISLGVGSEGWGSPYVSIVVGGTGGEGWGSGNGDGWNFGGHGGDASGAVISGIDNDDNSAVSTCNDDFFSINGIQHGPSGVTTKLRGGAGKSRKLI